VHTTPPFHADHVGSLLRPESLLTARAEHAAGRISAERLRAAEDDAIRDAVRMQKAVGLKSATDGEFRRTSWHMDFIYQLGGVHRADDKIKVQFHNAQGDLEFTSAALRVDGPIRLPETIFADAFTFLNSVVEDGVTAKLTIPSPSMVHYPVATRPSTRRSTRTTTSSGPTCPPPTPSRSGVSPRWAAPTCNWTTPASRTSTTRSSGPPCGRVATTRTTSTCGTSSRSTTPSPAGRRGSR